MMGDRYGEVTKVRKSVQSTGKPNGFAMRDVAHVKLDKSGKTVKVLLDDCEVI
jgi:hypothetical protein